MAQQVENLSAMQEAQEMRVWSLGREDPLEEEIATHTSILAWEIVMDGGVWQDILSLGSQRVRHHWVTEQQDPQV